jgi:hypothetical protein
MSRPERRRTVPTKRDLCTAEEGGWGRLVLAVADVPRDATERAGYYPEWSVKDMLGHIGAWQAEAVQIFEQIRVGTFRPEPIDVDAMNAVFVEALRDQPMFVVRAEAAASRTRFVQEFDRLPEVTRDAEEWFVESGRAHYQEHLPRLLEWTAELRAGGPG